jgi:hypothetical protein
VIAFFLSVIAISLAIRTWNAIECRRQSARDLARLMTFLTEHQP